MSRTPYDDRTPAERGREDDRPGRRLIVAGLPVGLGVAVLLAAAATLPVGARQHDMQAARGYYPVIVGSAINNCALCHVSEDNFGLDAYGQAYDQSGGDFGAIELDDSDGDGYSNIAEINAFTYPGKADSHPTAAPTVSPSPGPSPTPTSQPTEATATVTTAATEPTSPHPTSPHPTSTATATAGPSNTPEAPPPAALLPWAACHR